MWPICEALFQIKIPSQLFACGIAQSNILPDPNREPIFYAKQKVYGS